MVGGTCCCANPVCTDPHSKKKMAARRTTVKVRTAGSFTVQRRNGMAIPFPDQSVRKYRAITFSGRARIASFFLRDFLLSDREPKEGESVPTQYTSKLIALESTMSAPATLAHDLPPGSACFFRRE